MRGMSPLRRAVAASVGVHALLAVVLVAVVRWQAIQPAPPARPAIDTRVSVRMEFLPDDGETIDVPVSPPAEHPVDSHAPPDPPAEATDTRPPLVRTPPVPHTLPPELLALLRKPPTPDVIEVPITITPLHPLAPGGLQPAAAVTPPSSPRPNGPDLGDGSAVHGPLAAGQRIVYVLDVSGSMGEWGKFDTARRALIATLKKQPETVRFQVVVYAGFALVPLPAPVGGCVAATPDNVARMTDALAVLARPAGRSNHAAGLRAALELRPDFVLVFTDADDLPAATVRGAVWQSGTSAAVCVAKVGADGVAAPREVK